VRRICKKLGIDPIAFHALRATFLTHAAEAGLPISQLRALAGHADITTTAI
jgi:integrase